MQIPKGVRYSLIGIVAATSLLSACTVSTAGGIGGGLLTLLLALLLAGGTTATQTSCSPCLSPKTIPDSEGWTPDTAGDTADAEDTSRDTGLTPCLSPPPPDTDTGVPPRDTDVGPCLSILPDTDEGPDVEPTDTDPADTSTPDTDDAADADDATEMGAIDPRKRDRDQILAKLGDRLPDDVLERLDDSDDDSEVS